MIPVFKSHFSIGKSILTYEDPEKSSDPLGPQSILSIVKENKVKNVFILEDSMTGFPDAFRGFSKINKKFTFGLRVDYGSGKEKSKIAFFAKNDNGIKKLNELHSRQFSDNDVDKKFIEEWYSEDVALVIPFYDSFLFNNFLQYGKFIFDLEDFSPTFFLESNGLPFDELLKKKVLSFCDQFGFDTQEAKSIYYKNEEDAEALQALKIITNRSFGKSRSLSRPQLQHFGSRSFCWESFEKELEKVN